METHLSRNSLLFDRYTPLLWEDAEQALMPADSPDALTGDIFATVPLIADVNGDRITNFASFATQPEISASDNFGDSSLNQSISLREANNLEDANSILESKTSYIYESISLTDFSIELPVEPSGALTPNLNFSKIYVFGDSLSDPGNIYNATSFVQWFDGLLGLKIPVLPPSPPYFEGRYSNGLMWIDYLPKDLGITVTPSTELAIFNPLLPFNSPVTITKNGLEVSPYFNGATTEQSVNFAFGGAQTGFVGSDGEFGELIPGLLQQLEWFVEDHQLVNASADPNALYIVWAGANDYWSEENPNPEQSVENIEMAITSLYETGARTFLVPNLPDLGETPFAFNGGAEESERLTSLTLEHNAELDETIDDLRDELTGINIIEFDVYSIFNDAILNPERYGFTNVTEASLDPFTLVPVGNPNEYLFWDDVHPTSIVHEYLAEFALDTLTPQPDYMAGIITQPWAVLTF
jgi:phospholipase/lecithinase/hemolysin